MRYRYGLIGTAVNPRYIGKFIKSNSIVVKNLDLARRGITPLLY